MKTLFKLTPDILNVGEAAFNSLILELGKECRLVFDPKDPVICPNCIYDPNIKKSTGRYKAGGSKPFTNGRCPVCNGVGRLELAADYLDVLLLINWKPKPYTPEPGQVFIPGTIISTKGFIDDMVNIMACKYMIVDHTNAKLENNRFAIYSEPVVKGNIIKNKYFKCFWKREGN